ncbi:dephospho-CoA kinase, partial [Cloacibacillus evryensis]|uniref:dephospho-CoA kinase n=1 Tax=Cloacibacillus evryensis TaxID=508460 RepID=UPI0027E19961
MSKNLQTTRREAVIMPTVGLTGDVGAGKSTLCKEWAAMGAHIIDADSVARALWDDPSVFPPRGVCRDRP